MRGFVAAAVLLVGVGAWAAPLPVLVTDKAPVIDGRLDDAVWAKGQWLDGLHVPGEKKPAPLQIRFKIAIDRENFYVAARVEEPQLDKVRASYGPEQRDAPLWREDCVEVFLDCGTAGEEYFHFVVNPRGALYDAWNRHGFHGSTAAWDGDVKAAASKGDGEWAAEVAVALRDLNFGPNPWRFNIARERYASGKQELSLLAPGPEFHAVGAFPELAVPKMRSRPWMWGVKTPYEARVFRDGEHIVFEAKTHVTNLSGLFRFFALRPVVVGPEGQEKPGEPVSGGLDDGQGREFMIRVVDPPLGTGTLRLDILSRRTAGRVYARREWPVELRYTPIKVTLLRPRYRNSIFSTQHLKTIVARVELNVAESVLRSGRMEVKIVRVEDGRPGATVASRTVEKLSKKFTVELPAPREPGDYVVGFELIGVGGKVRGETKAEVPLRKLPPAKDEWYVGDNNVLYRNGQAFLPFGWFSMPEKAFATARADGYTAVQTYGSPWWSNEKLVAWLDKVHAAGLVAIFYPYPSAKWFKRERANQPLSAEERQALRERIRAVKNHPAVMGYYLCDEPELVPWLPLRLRQIYETIREEDPYHPCIVLNDTIPGIYKYCDGGDVLMPDPYPLFLTNDLAQQPIAKVAKYVKAVNEATGGLKPAWVTPQAFNYGDYGRPNNRAPTFKELRNMLYQAVVYGAKGFLWYTWAASQNYPDVGLGMPYLAKEIRDLREAVLAPETGGARVKCARPDEMHVSVRRAGGRWVIFAVNTATEAQYVTFDLSAVKGLPRELYVVGEGRTVKVAGEKLTDKFEVYATHIYTSDRKLAAREPIAAVLERIRKADEARRRPGNLAFEENGTTVEVSSKSRYGSVPGRLIDGVREGMLWRDGTPRKYPDWVVLRWPEPVRVGRVVVFSDTVKALEVQVPAEPGASPAGGDDVAWKTVARVDNASGDEITLTFAPVETRALRLLITAARKGEAFVTIREIEAYEK